ncbi:hypothetical protein FRC08_001837 [Ceratobasidium sp. 394]|nr:hypothetical protein FRC08_001837 [Ceratobasidium sp. 394]
MSGKEHRALQKVHLSVVANSDAKYSRELTVVTRALLDYIYYAQLPLHTEHTLKAFEVAYDEFHQAKDVWIKNGARRGEKTIIEHFNIPKLHTAGHMAEQIWAKGTAGYFSTETIKHLHMDTIKEAYPATNKKDWEKQTIRWLIRREKLAEFRLFQTWRKTTSPDADLMAKLASFEGGNTRDIGTPGSIETVDSLVVILVDTEAPVRQFKRGGFAPETISKHAAEYVPEPAAKLEAVAGKKRKRQIDDLDDKEERAAKRVERAQHIYALSEHQDIALRPTETLTVAAAQEKYGLPTLLADCKATHLVPASFGLQTVVGVWSSIRLQEPRCRMFPRVEWTRAHASPPSDKDPAVADPVMYLREGVNFNDRSRIRLQDCDIRRLRLIFCIVPTTEQPPSTTSIPVFAYMHRFRSTLSGPENATGMFVVTKPAHIRPQLVEISRITRLCPLAPHIAGTALPGVTSQTTLDQYSSFYINKYRSMGDFVFLNNLHPQQNLSQSLPSG